MKYQSGAINIVIIAAVVLGLLGLIVASAYVSQNPIQTPPDQTPNPSLTPAEEQQITLDYLSTGQIEEENIKNSPDLISVTTLPDGSTRYELRSPLVGRNNVLIIKDRQLLYKRTITRSLTGGRLPDFGIITAPLGAANQVLRGSRFFGPNYQTYIYSQKGTTLIASPDTGEVQEVQLYPKNSTIQEYLSSWGEDIAGYSPKIISPI